VNDAAALPPTRHIGAPASYPEQSSGAALKAGTTATRTATVAKSATVDASDATA